MSTSCEADVTFLWLSQIIPCHTWPYKQIWDSLLFVIGFKTNQTLDSEGKKKLDTLQSSSAKFPQGMTHQGKPGRALKKTPFLWKLQTRAEFASSWVFYSHTPQKRSFYLRNVFEYFLTFYTPAGEQKTRNQAWLLEMQRGQLAGVSNRNHQAYSL